MGLIPKRLPRQFNRTTSKKVLQYVKKRKRSSNPRQSLRFKRSARRAQKITSFIRQYGLKIALSTLLTVGIILFLVLIFSSIITVRKIAFDDTTVRIDKETVQNALKPLFGTHLFMVGRSSVLPLLQEVYPDVTNVELKKVYPDTLQLTFELNPLIAKLQIIDEVESDEVAQTITSSGVTNTHFITATGLYVQIALPTDTELDLPLYDITDWSVRPQPNQILLLPELLVAMQQAEAVLVQQFGYTITKRIVYVRAQEFHLQIGDRSLWFDVASPIADQLQRYRTFLETKINFPMKEYVDLRLSGRVVWK